MQCLVGSHTHGGKFNFAAGSEHSARTSERKRGVWIKESELAQWLRVWLSGQILFITLLCFIVLLTSWQWDWACKHTVQHLSHDAAMCRVESHLFQMPTPVKCESLFMAKDSRLIIAWCFWLNSNCLFGFSLVRGNKYLVHFVNLLIFISYKKDCVHQTPISMYLRY